MCLETAIRVDVLESIIGNLAFSLQNKTNLNKLY